MKFYCKAYAFSQLILYTALSVYSIPASRWNDQISLQKRRKTAYAKRTLQELNVIDDFLFHQMRIKRPHLMKPPADGRCVHLKMSALLTHTPPQER